MPTYRTMSTDISKIYHNRMDGCSHVRHQGIYSPGESLSRLINLGEKSKAVITPLTDPSWVRG